MGIGSPNPLLLASAASGGDSDPVTRSLRLAGSHYLTKSFSSNGDRKTYTVAFWVKRSKVSTSSNQVLFSAATTSHGPPNYQASINQISFRPNDTLEFYQYPESQEARLATAAVFRDVGAWMHCCFSVDTTQSTEANRVKIFVNGVLQSVATHTDYPSQDHVSLFNSTYEHRIGEEAERGRYNSDVLISDFYFIDGTALSTPVGNLIQDTGYGSYKPKAFDMSGYSGNSFHLKFEDSSDIGSDSTSNSNDWSTTGISSHDVLLDTPTANYPVLNFLDAKGSGGSDTFREGNLDVEFSNIRSHAGTVAATGSGKYYAEVYYKSGGGSNRIGVGVVSLDDRVKDNTGYSVGTSSNNEGGAIAVFGYAGQVFNNLGSTPTNANYLAQNAPSYAAIAVTDIVQIALDLDAGTVKFGLNGDWYNNTSTSSFSSAQTVSLDTTKIWTWFVGGQDSGSTERVILNAGQDPTFGGNKTSGQDTSQSEFFYAPPEGFKSLNTGNLAAPSVTPSENFNTVLYTGDGNTNHDITGVGFEPALTWIKSRSSRWHQWYDAARGAGKVVHSNSSNSESDNTAYFGPFQSDGFRLAPTTSGTGENASGENYVAWNWKAHQTPAASYNYNNTLTLSVEAYDQGYGSFSGWGTTKLEVIEGSTSLGFVSEPTTYDNDYGGYYVQYSIKTDDVSKIKLVWRTVDSDSDVFYDIYAYLENSSSTELASWDGYNYYGGGGEGDDAPETDDVFYPSSGHDSTNASTTGVLEVQATSSSSEKYNASAGFTIISYSGDGASDGDDQTLDHSLGVPLEFVIAKGRTNNDSMDNGNWVVYHKDLTDGDYLTLNSNSASDTPYNEYKLIEPYVSGSQHSVIVSNDTDSAGTDYLYLNSGPDNGVGEDYILYGWAGVEGYSKFGKYTGNGSTDGPFIYTGFRPAFVLWKRATGSSNSWNIMDNKREGYNPQNDLLFPDSSTSESNVTDQELLSNGFKLRTSGAGRNANNETFIYAAFAESPFKHANAR